MAITVQIKGVVELKGLINKLPSHMYDTAKKALSAAVLGAHSEVSDNFGPTGTIESRSGRLRRSILPEVSGETLNTLRGSLSTDVVYAPIQETGGTIKAKDKYLRVPGGPYLNIPLPLNKTPAGVMRKSAKQVFEEGGFLVKSKFGRWIVMDVIGLPMFVLVKEVTLKPRLGMIDAAEGQIPTLLSTFQSLLLKGI